MLETLVLKGGRNAQAPVGHKSEIISGNAIGGRSVSYWSVSVALRWSCPSRQ